MLICRLLVSHVIAGTLKYLALLIVRTVRVYHRPEYYVPQGLGSLYIAALRSNTGSLRKGFKFYSTVGSQIHVR